MRCGDLFAGIGGFALAAESVGWTVEWASEIEPFAREWYHRLFPAVTQYGDIRELKGSDLPPVDLLMGGFPCQDLSTANAKGKGLAGERSGLWREYARLVRECRPRWVVIENVGPLVRRGLDVVVRDLNDAGYAATAGLVSAAALGAPHQRTRLWIVAHRSGQGLAGAERETVQGPAHRAGGRGTTTERGEGMAGAVGDPASGGQRADGRAPRHGGHADLANPWSDWLPVRGADGTVRLVPAEAVEHADTVQRRGIRGRVSQEYPPEGYEGAGSEGLAQPGLRAGADGLPSGVVRGGRDDPQAWETPNGAGGGKTRRGGDRGDELLIGGQAEAWATPSQSDRRSASRTDEAQGHGNVNLNWQTPAFAGEPPDYHTDPAAVAAGWPVAVNVPNRTGMLRGAGNAIVPQIAAAIFAAIQRAESA